MRWFKKTPDTAEPDNVIEDIVAAWGNQGYHPRLEAAPARWTGTDFKILFDPMRDAPHWIG